MREAIKPERRATNSILKVWRRVGSARGYQRRKDVKRSEEGREKVGRFSFLFSSRFCFVFVSFSLGGPEAERDRGKKGSEGLEDHLGII